MLENSEMYAVEPGILFTLRCVMETSPFFLISVAYLGSIPFFGYMLRIGERPMNRVDGNIMIFEYANSMWNIIITMTTGKLLRYVSLLNKKMYI